MTISEQLREIRIIAQDIETKLLTPEHTMLDNTMAKRMNAKAHLEAIRTDAYRAEIMLVGIE